MKRYYKLKHKHRLSGHVEKKYIGIYSSLEKAENARQSLMTQAGFMDHPEGFYIRKVIRLFAPKLIDKTFWEEGFTTYHY